MVLDFTKGKYGLQLVLLLITLSISGLIFQLLGITMVNAIFDFDISSLTESNSSQLIMEDKNGYSIFFVLLVCNSIGMFILPALFFANMMSISGNQYLAIRGGNSIPFISLLPVFALSGIVLVGFMGELNIKIDLPATFRDMEHHATEIINYIMSFKSINTMLATLLLMAILPAIGEELFFRGIVQKILIKWTKKNWIGILLTAFIFSAIHLQFLTFLPRFFMGIMFGYLFMWSRNLIIPILAHFLHNSISILIAFYSESTEIENYNTINLWVILLSALLMGGVCYRYYKLSKKDYV